MYALKLILKYLLKRRIAWVSLIAVTLCTAMVLIVISVMGGWLRMFRASAHGISGDVVIHKPLTGFPLYEKMIPRIEELPGVEPGGAVPVVTALGLLNLGGIDTVGVQVYGYPLDKIGKVNAFPQSLYRQHQQYVDMADDDKLDLSRDERDALRRKADDAAAHATFAPFLPADEYRKALELHTPGIPKQIVEAAPKRPGLIAGIGVVRIQKNKEGEFEGRSDFLYRLPVALTLLPIGERGNVSLSGGAASVVTRDFWIVDDSRTKVWQYDNNTVYVDFDLLQRLVGMKRDPQQRADGTTLEYPSRVSEIHIKAKPGVDLVSLRVQVQQIVDDVYMEAYDGLPTTYQPKVETWEEMRADLIGAIEKEKLLVTFLFGIISIVAIFLIFCIFYMIVMEKTRDIGIIKSIGATGPGVAGIFIGYGLVIGIIGAGLGLLAAYLIVHNINELHTWLALKTGQPIWDPRVYQFDTIPNTMVKGEVIVICSIAVLSSVLGALVPAIRAARMHPIEALRYE